MDNRHRGGEQDAVALADELDNEGVRCHSLNISVELLAMSGRSSAVTRWRHIRMQRCCQQAYMLIAVCC